MPEPGEATQPSEHQEIHNEDSQFVLKQPLACLPADLKRGTPARRRS